MRHLKKIIWVIAFLLLEHNSRGQVTIRPIDTVKIYKNKTGVGFNIYLNSWYFNYGMWSSFSWNPKSINKQDSLVIIDHQPRFFKVYNSKNRLLFEGKTSEGKELQGEIMFYYKTGKIKRIEYWDNKLRNDSCGFNGIQINDAPGREGTWKFYYRNGKLKKEYKYIIKIYSCQPFEYRFLKQITTFKKNGKVKSVRQKKIR